MINNTVIFFIPSLSLVVFILPQFIFGRMPSMPMVIYFILIFIISLVFAFLLSKNKSPDISENRINKILFIFTLSYAVFFCVINFIIFDNFLSLAQDTPLFAQSIQSVMSPSNFLYNSFENASHFNSHVSPFLILLAPFYYIWPTPKILLILKVICLSLSILPLYLIMRFYHSKTISLFLSITFLLCLPVLGQMTFDFYETQFLPLVLLFAYYFWKKKKFFLHLLFLILSLSIREEISAILFMFGIYSWLKKRELKWIIYPILIGTIWGFIAFKLIMPFFSKTGSYHFQDMVFGDLLRIGINSFITKENLVYIYWLLAPLLLILPFFSWEWILGFPILFGYLYIHYSYGKYIGHHYHLGIFPQLFISLGGGLNFVSNRLFKRFEPEKIKLIIVSTIFLLTVAFSGGFYIDGILNFKKPTNSPRYILEEALKLIPSDASVLAPRYVNTHISNRLYLHRSIEEMHRVFSENIFAEFVLIDNNSSDNYTINYINKLFKEKVSNFYIYEKVYEKEGVSLYKLSLLHSCK